MKSTPQRCTSNLRCGAKATQSKQTFAFPSVFSFTNFVIPSMSVNSPRILEQAENATNTVLFDSNGISVSRESVIFSGSFRASPECFHHFTSTFIPLAAARVAIFNQGPTLHSCSSARTTSSPSTRLGSKARARFSIN